MGKRNDVLDYLRGYTRAELIVKLQQTLNTDYAFHNIKHYDLMILLHHFREFFDKKVFDEEFLKRPEDDSDG